MKTVKPNRIALRQGSLVVGLPDLQQLFDDLRSGGALVMEVEGAPRLGLRQLVLVADHKLNEILHEISREERETDPNLN